MKESVRIKGRPEVSESAALVEGFEILEQEEDEPQTWEDHFFVPVFVDQNGCCYYDKD